MKLLSFESVVHIRRTRTNNWLGYMKVWTNDESVSVVIEAGILPIACAEMDDMGDHWWVARVLVNLAHRRKGYGGLVVNALKEYSKGKPIMVHPGGYGMDYEDQKSFYESCGFVESEPGVLFFR